MSNVAAKMSYSGFLRGPTVATDAVERGDVLLERRDGVDLVLTTVTRVDANDEALSLGAVTLRVLSQSNPTMVASALAEQLPWLSWLPDADRLACTTELINDLAASAALHNFTKFHHDLVAWKHTAEVWSDPELARRLSGSFAGDAGKVARPQA